MAIQGLGYASGCAIWAGLTVVISFGWGSLYFKEPVGSIIGAVFSLLGIIVGISAVANCESLFVLRQFGDKEPLLSDDVEPQSPQNASKSTLSGLLCAVIVGITNGSFMLPFSFYAKHASGPDSSINYVISFSLGIIPANIVFFLLWFYFPPSSYHVPQFFVKDAAIPGIVTGVFWACANTCATFGTKHLGQTVGFPLTQMCICLTGLWGIFYFKEITRRMSIIIFFTGVVIIIIGAVGLTFSSKK